MASKPTFRVASLSSSSGKSEYEDTDAPRNVGLLAIESPDVAASPGIFYSVTRRHIASVYECTFYALSCTFTTDVSYVLHTYY